MGVSKVSKISTVPEQKLIELVDLKRYPLLDLSAPEAKEMIARCRQTLDDTGACEMPGFLTSWGIEKLVEEGVRYESMAFRNAVEGNAYLEEADPALPADHPKKMKETTVLGAVALDQFPADSLLRGLFEWDPLMYLVGAILNLEKIYRYADPMGGLNLAVMQPGDYLRWHFDQTDFVTSLALRSADEGGEFEYVPMIRNSKEENFDAVRRVLKGGRDGVVKVPTEPGSLILFRGRHSLHRVTPIGGKRSRLLGLLAYDTKEGSVGSDHLRYMRYGRSEPITQA